MRTRSRTPVNTTSNTGPQIINTTSLGGTAVYNWTIPYTSELKYEEITDDPSPGRGVKYVRNYSFETKRIPNSSTGSTNKSTGNVQTASGSGAPYWNWGFAGSGLTTGHCLDFGDVLALPDKTQDQLVRDAVDSFYNENEVNSLLNIVEAPQTFNLIKSIGEFFEKPVNLVSLRDSLRSFKRGSRRYIPSHVLQRLLRASGPAGVYLAYSFGVAPLISDMKKLSSELGNTAKRMKAASENQRREVTKRKSCGGKIVFASHLAPGGVREYNSSAYVRRFLVENAQPRWCCTVRGSVSESHNSVMMNGLLTDLKRFGSTGPATLAWELIPFSFVVDWFLDLREITNRIDNLVTGDRKAVRDISFSEKLDVVGSYKVRRTMDNYIPGDSDAVLAFTRFKYYRRIPVTSYNKVGLSGRFGKKQLSLSAALLHQKVANLLPRLARLR